jgi:nitroreductase
MSVWKKLLETAVYTPSPHNVQPWRLRILSDDTAELLIEKRRTLPKEDPTGSFIILSMGLFIEALTIVAGNSSLKLDFNLCQPASRFTPDQIAKTEGELLPFARLSLGKQVTPVAGILAESKFDNALFQKRRTSRISFTSQAVPNEAIETLSKLAREWGQSYQQVTAPEIIEKILERNIEAVFEDLNVTAYHDEIVEWFRFTDRSSSQTRDGLDYRCMNSSRWSFWLVARAPQLLQLPVARALLKKIYRTQLGHVPTIGMLAGPFWEPESAFETGRFLMRFWLELARQDLYIHPYGNLVTNKTAAERCLELTGVPHIWLIFRIGFSKVPPQSYRRTVEEVLVD